MGRVSRNKLNDGMIEMFSVAPRMGRVSRNPFNDYIDTDGVIVAPRMGRVSRNVVVAPAFVRIHVAPRMGRVSRNV